jgi:hypothetical protein
MFEKENAFFEANFPTLLKKYPDKELVISGDRILGVYDNAWDAVQAADKIQKSESVCIKHVDKDSLEPQFIYRAFPHPLGA